MTSSSSSPLSDGDDLTDLRDALSELGLDDEQAPASISSFSSTLDAASIRAAFREKAKKVHPDLNPHLGADEASAKLARLSRAAEVALSAARGELRRSRGLFSPSSATAPPESALSYLLRQRRVALGLSAALVAAGGGALWLSLNVHRDRYSRQVAEVVRGPPSEAAVAVSRMVEEARTDLKRRSRAGVGVGVGVGPRQQQQQ